MLKFFADEQTNTGQNYMPSVYQCRGITRPTDIQIYGTKYHELDRETDDRQQALFQKLILFKLMYH